MQTRALSTIRSSGRGRRRRIGSTLVEFALLVPVLLALIMGIIEFGWLVKNNLSVANAAREGARAAALGSTPGSIATRIITYGTPPIKSVGSPAVVSGRCTFTNGYVQMTYTDTSNATQNVADCITCTTSQNNVPAGRPIKIEVNVTHQSLTGFFPFLNNRHIDYTVFFSRETTAN